MALERRKRKRKKKKKKKKTRKKEKKQAFSIETREEERFRRRLGFVLRSLASSFRFSTMQTFRPPAT